jgi:hypothetical protein
VQIWAIHVTAILGDQHEYGGAAHVFRPASGHAQIQISPAEHSLQGLGTCPAWLFRAWVIGAGGSCMG